jgi:Na+/H+ antiporter NhaD/arsenite permease-like protein
VLQLWIEEGGPTLDPRLRDGSIYALAIGSNFGAFTFTFSASLAGLLWRDILSQKGIIVRQWVFCKFNSPLVVIAMTAASAVLVGEVYIIHRKS